MNSGINNLTVKKSIFFGIITFLAALMIIKSNVYILGNTLERQELIDRHGIFKSIIFPVFNLCLHIALILVSFFILFRRKKLFRAARFLSLVKTILSVRSIVVTLSLAFAARGNWGDPDWNYYFFTLLGLGLLFSLYEACYFLALYIYVRTPEDFNQSQKIKTYKKVLIALIIVSIVTSIYIIPNLTTEIVPAKT